MSSTGVRRAARRAFTGFSLVAASSLILPLAVAHADPDELESEIDALTEEVSELVEELNQAEEDVEAAEKRLEELQDEIGDEEERYEELRESVVEFAGALYGGSDLDSPSSVLTAGSPEEIQEKAADLGYLSENQTAQLDEFSGSAERLFSLREESEETLEDAEERRDELEEQRDEVESTLSDREDELAEITGEDGSDSDSDSDSEGASYTGSATGNAGAALDYAFAQVGKAYCSGGTGPDCYDCSGLTMMSWQAAGVSLPRVTGTQQHVGQAVSYSDIQPGDLLFFYSGISHVGLYAGNGQMVHAPNPRKSVEVVPLAGYWQGEFQFARRP
ncbi:C40 family peptidase [Spiractinospora alimapuensis]|uniref:C40 family peptidase n=1 Tax=Spiractinospora alimapuensis TaxID=2820884 RepID=UPI001F49186A|nr:C40 family peptidase [Spiractinospora alimapuensis]QVQ53230.1 C40 family peptidase [Spiractinospora alimapuensis]